VVYKLQVVPPAQLVVTEGLVLCGGDAREVGAGGVLALGQQVGEGVHRSAEQR